MVGTDGLFDNLFDDQIIELIKPHVKESESGDLRDVNKLADSIATEAERLSRDSNYISPFAKAAQSKIPGYSGGKQDDITVAVA